MKRPPTPVNLNQKIRDLDQEIALLKQELRDYKESLESKDEVLETWVRRCGAAENRLREVEQELSKRRQSEGKLREGLRVAGKIIAIVLDEGSAALSGTTAMAALLVPLGLGLPAAYAGLMG